MFHTITIVGVGLIGGSVGLAVRRRGLAERVIGVCRDDTARVVELGLVDEALTDGLEAVRRADLAVFCVPVQCMADEIVRCGAAARPETILTDVGSTKAEIVRAIEAEPIFQGSTRRLFVGGHPLAGSARHGPDHARPDLFQDRITILTRTENTSESALHRLRDFWQALGSRVRILAPDQHDEAVAHVSHLPHLLAAALLDVLPAEWRSLVASGFRDTTRIASGMPELWTGIFMQNRDALTQALFHLQMRLDTLRQVLDRQDAATLTAFLAQSKSLRDALDS